MAEIASSKRKSPAVILVILIILSLSLAGITFYLLQKERTLNLKLQQELGDVTTRKDIAETKLQKAQEAISGLELKLKEAKTQIETLTSQWQQERVDKEEAQTQIEQIRVDLEQQRGLRQDLEKKLTRAQKDTENLQTQLKELESKKAELETKVKDLEAKSQGVELGKIVVGPETIKEEKPKKEKLSKELSVSSVSSIEGKILVINKDYNFAVINLGSKDRVEVGDEFLVYHKNKYIGDIKVEKVHDSMAACGFVSGDIKDKINEDDKVVQKTK